MRASGGSSPAARRRRTSSSRSSPLKVSSVSRRPSRRRHILAPPAWLPEVRRRANSIGSGGCMASKLKIKVNGLMHSVTASLDTPLLYVLHNELHLHGPRFGCGLAQCGACSVLLDGKEIRSCVTPVAAVSGKAITTLEGL